ncbi:hypothetical protein FOA52_014637 [Chlamydomonas sp. UWO 241]|nr:hypothetical protein FOA52_014637 [Chlamydomonas sp. UWO 241]
MALMWLALLALAGWSADASAVPPSLLHKVLHTELNAHLQKLGEMSDRSDSLERTFMSPAHKQSADRILWWMKDAGMEAWVDVVGNVHGRITGSDASLPALFFGSHYDTVKDAGKFDGPLGVLAAIAGVKMAVMEALHARGDLPSPPQPSDDYQLRNVPPGLLQRTVRVVAFSDEEGVRFQSTFLGSRALAGTLSKYGMLKTKDEQGLSLASVLEQESKLGGLSVEDAVAAAAVPAHEIAEYVEVHMEQGPVLEARGLPLGVVSAIAGQTRLWVIINGTQGHAGTVPMRGRTDAVAAAAAVVSLVERRCGGGPGGGTDGVVLSDEADMLVCTVGDLRVWPGASNVIAGGTQLSVDIRAKSDNLRHSVVANVTASVNDLCAQRGVSCEIQRKHDAEAVMCDDGVVETLRRAVVGARAVMAAMMTHSGGGSGGAGCGCGGGSKGSGSGEAERVGAKPGACSGGHGHGHGHEHACENPCTCGGGATAANAPVMVSGAGHDAMALAEVSKMGMLFVRCRGGVSHHPSEHVEPDDVAASAAALYKYILERAG